MPNLVANTFYNFSNNLQGLNVCPYCLVLTMYSILNCRVSRYAFYTILHQANLWKIILSIFKRKFN